MKAGTAAGRRVGCRRGRHVPRAAFRGAGPWDSVAPLAWTDAVTLLALLAQAGHLATIPVPPAK